MFQDLRHALRLLAKNPLFALVGIVTLALGIGATTAVFTLVNALLIKPLPYDDPSRVVLLFEHFKDQHLDAIPVSPPEFLEYKAQLKSFDKLAAFTTATYNLSEGDLPERIFGAVIGFGFALVDEVRHPRIADAYEAERATGVRVLGVISPLPQSPERGRRSSDRDAPPYIDPGADGHQLIYLHVASAGSNVLMLTITGDNPAVSAVVAINFAAIAAHQRTMHQLGGGLTVVPPCARSKAPCSS
jgi:hypothetical protein